MASSMTTTHGTYAFVYPHVGRQAQGLHHKRTFTQNRNGPVDNLHAFSNSLQEKSDQAASTATSTKSSKAETEEAKMPSKSYATLGFLSFDLDDTLWPTSQVVNDANEEMMRYLNHRIQVVYGKNEKPLVCTVEEFLDKQRTIRRSLTTPMRYRDLRKTAVEQLVLAKGVFQNNHNDNTGDDSEERKAQLLAEDCYNVWITARHAAADKYLYDDVVETLEQIRHDFPNACIAAITNGGGNPLCSSNSWGQVFDFCVSGEDDPVFPHRKPHPAIFEYSFEQYKNLYPHHHQQLQDEDHQDQATKKTLALDCRRLWIHVGDCLANDVGASASCGAYAVWIVRDEQEKMANKDIVKNTSSGGNDEPEKRQENQNELQGGGFAPLPSWSTASTQEVEKRQQLANEGREKIAVRITSIAELPGAIRELISQ